MLLLNLLLLIVFLFECHATFSPQLLQSLVVQRRMELFPSVGHAMPPFLRPQAGAEWKSGLAWALIGGLISSLLLTLVLVPIVYSKLDEWRETIPALVRRGVRKRSRRPAPSVFIPEPVPVTELETETVGQTL